MIDNIINWAQSHWWLVTAIGLAIASVLNSITVHYGAKYPRIVPLFGVLLEALSFLTSRGAVNGRFGKFKLPLQDVGGRAIKNSGKATRVTGLIVLLLFVGCAHNQEPRKCSHLLGVRNGVALTPWDDTTCKSAQVKRDWLLGVTAGLAVAGGAGGIGSVFPEEQRFRLAVGITSAALAIGAAVLTPFLTSAQENLSDHCVEYHDPMAQGGKR